ncbi:MAG: hypothetical protein WCA32_14650, partial [Chromatiaceae bacterium]
SGSVVSESFLSAEDILKVATRALAENPTSSASSTGCLLRVSDDDSDFPAIFVRRKSGIRSFYPDATPDPRRWLSSSCPARGAASGCAHRA